MNSVSVRRACLNDAAAIAAIYAPFVTDSVVSFELNAPSPAEMRDRLEDIGSTYPWIVAEEEGLIGGYAYASRHSARPAYQWSADVTIYLNDGYRGRGLGKRIYQILFSILKLQGYRSLYGGITLPNEVSLALHRSMGMTEVGVYRNVGFKFGSWRDVIWLGMSFDNGDPPKGPPIPITKLSDSDLRALFST